MKKITLLTFLLLLNLTYSQEVLNETFDSAASLPAGWTNTNTSSDSELWSFSDNQDFLWLFTAGNNYFTLYSGGSGNNALFNSSGYAGTQINDVYLTSPVFDCTNLSDIKLSYGYYILSSAVGSIGSGFIEVFDGTSWVIVSEYSEQTIAPDANNYYWDYGETLIDVSDTLAGVSNAQLRVRFSEVTAIAWGMKIDNIVVQQPQGDPPGACTNPNPADSESDVVINQYTSPSTGINYKWVEVGFTAGEGPAATSYDVTYSLNSDLSNPILSATDYDGTIAQNGSLWGTTADEGWQPNTTYYWKVTSNNLVGSTDSEVWSFTTGPVDPLGTEDYQENEFKVYPNPVNDMLNIDGNVRIDSIEVINQLGQRVLNINGSSLLNNQVNLGKLKSGLYFIKMTSNDKTEIIQIIKQ